MLEGKTVVLGVTGSIAAYKMANVASMLGKLGAEVHVVMTENATNFINPITFETLTNHKCLVDTFDRNFQFHVAHVSLAKQADVFLVAPATANIIGKMANGLADDMLSTMLLAAKCPILVSPAMNTNMFENRIVQDNLSRLQQFGITVIPPEVGRLACRDVGAGKMPGEDVLVDYVLREIAAEKDLAGKKVLVTAGPTRENIDPVRFITNHSTGKMGYAVARQAMLRGAEVILVSGPVEIAPPPFVRIVSVESAEDMFEAVTAESDWADAIIMAAAVADYTPAETADQKIKKKSDGMFLPLTRTKDILAYLGEHKKAGQLLCGFSMETEQLLENSGQKLLKKHADMIAANSLREAGAGFGTDTNHLILLTEKDTIDVPMMSKEGAADILLTELFKLQI
ncbi:MAG: bifunctional phosphopantothenoylcysteine decarboxylase/phosphopantothenate--cysteine ligase CoaBC [Lachnospiraceae bacterium]